MRGDKMEKINPKRALVVAAIVIAYGFHTVMQVGQPAPVFQNDGDAFVGGVMILLGGVLIGAALTLRKLERKGTRNGKR
jgi:hypothetical protein